VANVALTDQDIKDFVDNLILHQNNLVEKILSISDDNFFDNRGNLVSTAQGFRQRIRELKLISADSDLWHVRYHGCGLCFTRCRDGHVVDIDQRVKQPNMFSTWRLSLFLESLGIEIDSNILHERIKKSGVDLKKTDRYFWELSNA
jgi:hypothetical protein